MVVIVWGSRPEAIKLGPVVAALRANHTPVTCVATGQHTTLLAGTPAETDLADSRSLGLETTGEVTRWPQFALPVVMDALQEAQAGLVVVQGDTMSAVVGARAASRLGIPLAHVEAGLRSGNLDDPFPEERFRREITQLATYHCAPTLSAADSLMKEGIARAQVFVTGNPVVSAIQRYTGQRPVKTPDPVMLFTMHRREWLQAGIMGVLTGLLESAQRYPDVDIVWPIHPAVGNQLPEDWIAGVPVSVRIVAPLPYREAIRLLARSVGVATDSGGLVEEAATLGVPCAILRHVCDRPESLTARVAQLFPPTRDGVRAACSTLVNQTIPRSPSALYGTPHAAATIAGTLHSLLVPPASPPTPPSLSPRAAAPAQIR